MLNEITSTGGNLAIKGIGRFTAEELTKELHELDNLDKVYMIKEVTDETLGKQVRTSRQLQGLKSSEVADYLGISNGLASMLENGTALPKNKGLKILDLVNFANL